MGKLKLWFSLVFKVVSTVVRSLLSPACQILTFIINFQFHFFVPSVDAYLVHAAVNLGKERVWEGAEADLAEGERASSHPPFYRRTEEGTYM